MQKLILCLVLSIFLSASLALALTPEQTQFYWGCLEKDGCLKMLKEKFYPQYKSCALNCSSKAAGYSSGQAWCQDSDGQDYFKAGTVTTNVYPNGKKDNCKTFSNGKEYLVEGICTSNKIIYIQQKCGDLGNYACKDGACVQNLPQNPGCWEKGYGGDQARMAQPASDGGYLIAANTWLKGAGKLDGWLLKTDALGNLLWDKTFGGSEYDIIHALRKNKDGDYFMAGWSGSTMDKKLSAWVIKLDSKGNLKWEEKYGSSPDSIFIYDLYPTDDGGAVLAGNSLNEGIFSDVVVLKVDGEGNLEWKKSFGGSEENDEEYGYSIQQTKDGGYVIAGTKWSVFEDDSCGDNGDDCGDGENFYDGKEGLVIKLNSLGEMEWDKTYSSGKPIHELRSIQQTADGGYICAGYGNFESSGNDGWILKLDAGGNKEWEKQIGEPNQKDYFYSVQQTSDLGYVAVGRYANQFAWIVKMNKQGKVSIPDGWNKYFNDKNGVFNSVLLVGPDYLAVGWKSDKGAWLAKLSSCGQLSECNTESCPS